MARSKKGRKLNLNLGLYISTLREQKNLSQRDLAKRAGLSYTTIQRVESGETKHPGVDVIVSIANALSAPPLKLIMAYQGKDPDDSAEKHTDEKLSEILRKALEIAEREQPE